ncbi:hypothetical protein N9C97_04330 [Candidatus Pelagibacter sp.]|nr:hypothetical protein [Candidatus Pelagibacter sp.]
MTLIILNILVWLGPFFISLRKGTINTLHPQFITPMFMIYFILNSYVQEQTNWMQEGNRAITVGVVKLLPPLDPISFSFESAYIISLLAGIFFHLGSGVFNKSIYNSINEHTLLNKKDIIYGNKILLFFVTLIISSIVWLPNYYLDTGAFGTFWTYPLALSVFFVPVAVLGINRILFFITLIIALFVASYVLKSKAAFTYIFMPIFFYVIFFNFNFIKFASNKNNFKKFILTLVVFLILISSLFIGNKYGKMDTRLFFRRDYAFEIFAILVESKKLGLINNEKSWIKNEVKQAIPSFILKSKRTTHINPAKRVAIELFPETAISRPNTYWNRHFLFAGYYDFGIFGALVSAFLFGSFFSYTWKVTKEKVFKYNTKWPIFVYLPIPSFGAYFLACGGYAYSILNTLVASIILLIIFYSARFRLS